MQQPPPKSVPRTDAPADLHADAPAPRPLPAATPVPAEAGDAHAPCGAGAPPRPGTPAPAAAAWHDGGPAADDDRTLYGAPAPTLPGAPAAGRETMEADDDRTVFAAPAQDDDRTLFAVPVPATTVPRMPTPGGTPAPGLPADADDERTLYGLPTPAGVASGPPGDAEAPTVVVSQDDIPTLRMPAPGAAAARVSVVNDDDRTLYASDTGGEGSELTLRMPAPGGQANAARTRGAPAPGAALRSPRAGVELQRLVAGVNPLLGAASVLLALAAQLRATSAHADPAGLRRQLLAHVADFEAQAAASGVARPRITAARYLLCTFLDEVIAATPWGQGRWEAHTLLSEFHEERFGGVKAFELLEKLGEDPAANAEVLELFYVCLALGFEGRWRGQPDGRVRLEAIAERVLQTVRPAALQRQAEARCLSLRWQGVQAPQRPGLHLPPLWSVAVLAGALVLAALLLLQQQLAAQARPLLRELQALPAALQPQRAAAAQAAPAPAGRLAPLLQSDAAAGTVAVRDERLRSVLTLPADALFKGGSAELQPGAVALLGRIAQALRGVPGQVNVIAHGDEGGGASLQFPSAWHLTRERALAVMGELSRLGVPSTRLHAEGRGDAEPLAAGHAAADRARNRRVEIELRLPRPEE